MFVGQPDFELVGEAADPVELLLKVKRTGADVVVLTSAGQADAALASHLFGEYQDLTVLVVSVAGTFIQQLCPRARFLSDRSPGGILAALRSAVAHPCEGD